MGSLPFLFDAPPLCGFFGLPIRQIIKFLITDSSRAFLDYLLGAYLSFVGLLHTLESVLDLYQETVTERKREGEKKETKRSKAIWPRQNIDGQSESE